MKVLAICVAIAGSLAMANADQASLAACMGACAPTNAQCLAVCSYNECVEQCAGQCPAGTCDQATAAVGDVTIPSDITVGDLGTVTNLLGSIANSDITVPGDLSVSIPISWNTGGSWSGSWPSAGSFSYSFGQGSWSYTAHASDHDDGLPGLGGLGLMSAGLALQGAALGVDVSCLASLADMSSSVAEPEVSEADQKACEDAMEAAQTKISTDYCPDAAASRLVRRDGGDDDDDEGPFGGNFTAICENSQTCKDFFTDGSANTELNSVFDACQPSIDATENYIDAMKSRIEPMLSCFSDIISDVKSKMEEKGETVPESYADFSEDGILDGLDAATDMKSEMSYAVMMAGVQCGLSAGDIDVPAPSAAFVEAKQKENEEKKEALGCGKSDISAAAQAECDQLDEQATAINEVSEEASAALVGATFATVAAGVFAYLF